MKRPEVKPLEVNRPEVKRSEVKASDTLNSQLVDKCCCSQNKAINGEVCNHSFCSLAPNILDRMVDLEINVQTNFCVSTESIRS